MLMLPILLSSLALTPVKDTLWWHTPGGQVTQHRDGDKADCTLRFDSDDGNIAFVWDRTLPTRVVVERPRWNIPPDQITTVAIRIGDAWLEHGNGTPNIPAMTASSAVMFILNQPIDDLLSAASDIALTAPFARFAITLTRSRMAPLLAALQKCRAVIEP